MKKRIIHVSAASLAVTCTGVVSTRMERTMLLQTAALLMTAAAATGQVLWDTIDTWQYAPGFHSQVSAAISDSSGTLLVGGRCLASDGRTYFSVVKAYHDDGAISIRFCRPCGGGGMGGLAAGEPCVVYLTGQFPDAAGVPRWTVFRGGDYDDMVTPWQSYDQSSGSSVSNERFITYYGGKVYVTGTIISTGPPLLRTLSSD